MAQHPILDALNNYVKILFPGAGSAQRNTLSGLPLGKTAAGEVAVKVLGAGAGGGLAVTDVPSTNMTFTRVGTTNNIATIAYTTLAGAPVATTTFTYFGGGAADDDMPQTITTVLA